MLVQDRGKQLLTARAPARQTGSPLGPSLSCTHSSNPACSNLAQAAWKLPCAMGKDCLGPWWSPHLNCRLRNGRPKTVETKGCKRCKMQRCKTHCKCAGTQHAQGRSAPRQARGTSSSAPSASSSASSPSSAPARARTEQPEPEPSQPARVVPPALGRPSPLAAEGFLDASWLDAAKRELRTARSVIIAALA